MVARGPLSILLISHSYPPVLGGSEVEAQRVCRALLDRGHRVQVLCAGGGPMPRVRDWVDPKGVPVRMYGGDWAGPARDLVFAAGTAFTLIREGRRYDLVYFLMQGMQLAVGLPLARGLGVPIVMKVSGSGVFPLLTRSFTGRLELAMLRRWAKQVLILNEGMRHEAEAIGFRPSQLTWMPNPIDGRTFAPCTAAQKLSLRARLGVPANAGVVVYTGRLSPEKGLDCLLQSFALTAQRLPDSHLLLVGDGMSRTALAQRAVQLSLDPARLRFVGAVPAEQIPDWLQLADVFALTSPAEGFSCSLAEAMSSGLACLASDIPANRQLIQSGENGVLVPAGDARAAASGLGCLLQDSALRARLGNAARQLISTRYSTAHVADLYERVFGEAIQACAAPATAQSPSGWGRP